MNDGPCILMRFAFRPGQVAEIEFNLQMTGNDIQNNFPDLLKSLRDARYIRKDHPDVAELLFLLGQRFDSAAGNRVVDVRQREAVSADPQQRGNGLAAQLGAVVDRRAEWLQRLVMHSIYIN